MLPAWLEVRGAHRRGDLMPSFATMPTPGGHLAGEVASALQKSIRRGLEREALYWASELDLAGFGDYLWRRLRIIASEDVGMAAPEVAVQVRALSENFVDQRKHNKTSKSGTRSGERLFIVQAMLILVEGSQEPDGRPRRDGRVRGRQGAPRGAGLGAGQAHGPGQAARPRRRPLLRRGGADRERRRPRRPVRRRGAEGPDGLQPPPPTGTPRSRPSEAGEAGRGPRGDHSPRAFLRLLVLEQQVVPARFDACTSSSTVQEPPRSGTGSAPSFAPPV